jgi:hypothetical protein
MTQAFNLAQLANNLNTSGQLDATDGLSGIVPMANGGTGQSSFTANSVLLGNGTSTFQTVAPGTSGNALVSNGTTWQSGAISQLATASGSAPSYSVRAWVNFSGVTSVINDSRNVSSITKFGTGSFHMNYSVAMNNTAYAAVTNTNNEGSAPHGYIAGFTANYYSMTFVRDGVGVFDPATATSIVIG